MGGFIRQSFQRDMASVLDLSGLKDIPIVDPGPDSIEVCREGRMGLKILGKLASQAREKRNK